eukprot:CAMPEP_0172447242 /NCGR_PEP_ID=MMETSP1065-20121228/6584_1 /TAXON_ID=265537 /ORGANISM="Amphiprora paludosa, Strain CCMP125" /LENGTH=87 /DNA_ID=CAMNT_0013198487 /DNA_START=415 /DNA_END=678 /DNA_ORIENTATION=+
MTALTTSMKGTWYQECNPTARKTVYNDVFLDYGDDDSFGAADSSWLMPQTSNVGASTTPTASSSNPRRGPLRRVARWARNHVLPGGP